MLDKVMNETLFIGCFDIQKVFDKVSSLLMLNKLKYGTGYCMLKALKAVYCYTSCILTVKGNTSCQFQTYCGIRQGAVYSSPLFILFIDNLIEFIQRKCTHEPLIDTFHCLLHADDMLIISTSRANFIRKWNLTSEYFDQNQLIFNLSKSWYLIINANTIMRNAH